MEARVCPRCAREQPATAQGSKCLFCGAELPAEQAPTEQPAQAAAPGTPAPASSEGKRPCPRCGEVLYETEARCWRCGHEFSDRQPPPETEAPPAPTPVAPPAPLVPQFPPALPPTDETPAAEAPTPTPSEIPATPYYPATVPIPTAPHGGSEAQTWGVWALILSVLGLCCPIVPAIVAIYLGIQANRRGATGLGVTAIVIAILALLVWLVILALIAIGGSLAPALAEGTVTP